MSIMLTSVLASAPMYSSDDSVPQETPFSIMTAFADDDHDDENDDYDKKDKKKKPKEIIITELSDDELIEYFQDQVTTIDELSKVLDEAAIVDVSRQKIDDLKNKIELVVEDKKTKKELVKILDDSLKKLDKTEKEILKLNEEKTNKKIDKAIKKIIKFIEKVDKTKDNKVSSSLKDELTNDASEILSVLNARDNDIIPIIENYDLPLTDSLFEKSKVEFQIIENIFTELENRGIEVEITAERNSPPVTTIKIRGVTTIFTASLESLRTVNAVDDALDARGEPRLNNFEKAGLFLINAAVFATPDLFIPIPAEADFFKVQLAELVLGQITNSEFVDDVYLPTVPAIIATLLVPIEVEAIISLRDHFLPILTVITDVINNNDGTRIAGDFIVNVIGTNPVPAAFAGADGDGVDVRIAAGTYAVTQDPLEGYTISYSDDCTSDVNGPLVAADRRTCVITTDDVVPVPVEVTVQFVSSGEEDGYFGIAGSSCAGGAIVHTTDDAPSLATGPRLWNPSISAVGCYRAWSSWDVSSIPDGAQIIDTKLTYDTTAIDTPGFPNGAKAGTIFSLEQNPVGSTPNAIRADIRDGTQYVANDLGFGELGVHTVDLGPSADTRMETSLADDWFGIGISHPNEATNVFKTSLIASGPILTVTYLEP